MHHWQERICSAVHDCCPKTSTSLGQYPTGGKGGGGGGAGAALSGVQTMHVSQGPQCPSKAYSLQNIGHKVAESTDFPGHEITQASHCSNNAVDAVSSTLSEDASVYVDVTAAGSDKPNGHKNLQVAA